MEATGIEPVSEKPHFTDPTRLGYVFFSPAHLHNQSKFGESSKFSLKTFEQGLKAAHIIYALPVRHGRAVQKNVAA